jgi:hypothetical protein
MPKDPKIEAVRLRTNEAERELLGDDVLGYLPETQLEKDDIVGHRRFFRLPVRVLGFGGQPKAFPVFKTTMVLTAISTAYLLSVLYPAAPQVSVDARLLAALPRSGSMTAHPPLTPQQARVKRLQDLHRAATESSVPSSAQDISASVSSSESSDDSSAPAPVMPAVRPDNKTGVYLTASSVARKAFFHSTVSTLQSVSGSALVFDVKGSGVLFHSAAPMANETGLVKPFYDLPAIIQQLHQSGVYVIGRFVAIKDDALTTRLPDTRIKNPKTGKVLSQTWVDPSNDTAIEFNMQVVCELAAAGIDEINLDYIRFSTAEFGALGVYSGQEKADRVEKFIRATRETIDRCGPNTKLGLSTFAILGWNYDVNVETLGQDVVRFAPLVDVISPMAYPATFTSAGYYVPGKHPGPRNYWLVYRTLTGYTKLLGPDHAHKIRPWIQGYSVAANDMSDQIRAVYDAGFCGWTVWNAGNNYKPSYTAMGRDTIRPERCFGDGHPDMSVALGL